MLQRQRSCCLRVKRYFSPKWLRHRQRSLKSGVLIRRNMKGDINADFNIYHVKNIDYYYKLNQKHHQTSLLLFCSCCKCGGSHPSHFIHSGTAIESSITIVAPLKEA